MTSFCILFLLISTLSYGQTEVIVVNQSAQAVELHILRVTNNYSNSGEGLFSGTVKKDSSLVVRILAVKNIEKLMVSGEKGHTFMFIEADRQYKLKINQDEPLKVSIEEEVSEINDVLVQLDNNLKEVNHYKDFFGGTRESALGWLHLGRRKKRYQGVIRKIQKSIKQTFQQFQHSQYLNAINYYLAPYALTKNFKKDRLEDNLNLANTLFDKLPIDYNNPFFAESYQFFYGYSLRQNFMVNDHYSNESAIKESVKAFDEAYHMIQKMPRETGRQLAFLSLVDSYYHSYHSNIFQVEAEVADDIEKILDEPGNATIQQYAEWLKNEIFQLKEGNPAPDFQLITYDGDSIRLSQLKGKYVYLDFWFSRCAPCIAAMENLKNTHKNYGDAVVFVSINGFDDFDTGKKIVEENNFIGINLHAGKNHQILKDYNVNSYPTYYLISPEGNILYKPVNYYEREFDKVMKYIN